VLLVKGYGWSYREVADLMEVGVSTVQKHVDRALARLRKELEVDGG
jgi:DNA-directed RNA polymerase specialized sigma24 family protein